MPEPFYRLNESDVRELRRVVSDSRVQRGQLVRQRDDSLDHEEILPPEVYVAKTPAGGIAAMDVSSTLPVPGYATCTIYRIIFAGIVPQLTVVGGLTKIVYNLALTALPADTWVKVSRDKYGQWYADASSGGSEMRVQLTAVCFYDGSDTRDLNNCATGIGLNCDPDTDCPPARYPLYSWTKVTDLDDPDLITWLDGNQSGSPQCWPVIQERGESIPVFPGPSPLSSYPREWESVSGTHGGTGTAPAGTGTGTGSEAWADVSNVWSSDDGYATVTLGPGETSDWLVVTKFCYGIGGNATVDTVEARIEAKASESGLVVDADVRLVVDGVVSGSNKASGTTLSLTDTVYSYSYTPSQWGVTLTPLKVNKSGFGYAFRYRNNSGSTSVTVSVDAATMRLGFSPAGFIGAEYSIVTVRKGAGNWWITDQVAVADVYHRTGNSDADGEIAYLSLRDQNATPPSFKDYTQVRLINYT